MSGLHLTKTERRQVEAVEAAFKPWGLTFTLERTHHLAVIVAGPRGGKWRLMLACTPRDPDVAVRNASQKAKALVQQINARLGF